MSVVRDGRPRSSPLRAAVHDGATTLEKPGELSHDPAIPVLWADLRETRTGVHTCPCYMMPFIENSRKMPTNL